MNNINKNFDWKYYYENKSHNTDRAVESASRRNQSLARDASVAPPLRGFWNRYADNWKVILRILQRMVDRCISSIDRMDISQGAKSALKTFEMYQTDQKGPVTPIPTNGWTDQVEEPFIRAELSSSVLERSEELKQNFLELYQHFKLRNNRINAEEIDFEEHWRQLPSSTKRGFPYNTDGKNVDDQIVGEGGRAWSTALAYFLSLPQNISFTGVRLQGTPALSPGKIRMISMPSVKYQYVNVGLVHTITNYIKNFSSFCGMNSPDIRDSMIVNAIRDANEKNCVIIPMDYSKFDRSCNPVVRGFAYESIAEFFGSTSGISEWHSHMVSLANNQFLMFARNNQVLPVSANGLLLSGVIDTQLTGSLINLSMLVQICKELNSPILIDSCLVLGDDVGLPISKNIVEKWGYKGVLMKVNEILEKFGFKSNVDKAYPEPHLVFLQRLYLPSYGIIGVGSYVRTLMSWAFKERYSKLPEGIKSLKGIELFQGIAMFSDVETREPFYKEFRAYLADVWIELDDGLKAVLSESFDSSLDEVSNAHRMVSLIIDITTNDIQVLLEYFGVHGYDRYNLAFSLSQPNYGQVFNFARELVSAWGRGNYVHKTVKSEFEFDVVVKAATIDSEHDFVED